MPLYEYQCDACGHRFEIIQKFSDPPVEKCPSCGGIVRKLQSAPAFQFKGTGWYITDYARSGKAGGEPAKSDTTKDKDAAKTTSSGESTSGASSSSSPSSSGTTSSSSASTPSKKE